MPTIVTLWLVVVRSLSAIRPRSGPRPGKCLWNHDCEGTYKGSLPRNNFFTFNHMQIETINTLKDNYDYYTLTWRQVTDACGEPISSKDAAVWTGKFTQGEVKHDAKGRDQLLMFMCSPYGYYEVEIVIVGGKKGATGAVHWEVELGPSQEHIWDTWNPEEYRIPKYNPDGPGTYIFPLEDEDDPHMAKMWPGPEPGMDDCESYGGSGDD